MCQAHLIENKHIFFEQTVEKIEREIGILKQEIMSMKCEVEKIGGGHQEVEDMLRVVRVCKFFYFTIFLHNLTVCYL